jgi:trigger factor
MKILKQERLPKSQVKLVVEVSKNEVATFLDKAYEQLKTKVEVAGFRPGRAPRSIVEKEVGSERFQKEALEIALPETYYDAIKETKIRAIGPPQIKMIKFVPSDCLVYEATLSVLPEFRLGDYKKIITESGLKPKEVKVGEKQVEEVIKNLQKQKAETKPVLRAAKKGDRVEVDFESFVGGRPIPGGSSKNHPIILGDGIMIPGFEKSILGMQKGEEKKFNLTFPESFHKKDLAGKKGEFRAKLKEIHEIKLPHADDEFSKKLGHKNLTELKDDIKKHLEKELAGREQIRFESELIEKITQNTQIEIPQILIEEELEKMFLDFEQKLSKQGLKIEHYLEQIKKTKDDLRKEWQKEAEKRIKIALILDKIAQEEKVEISSKEVEDEIKNILNTTSPDKKDEMSKKLENEEQKQYIKNILKNRKVVKFLKNLVEK